MSIGTYRCPYCFKETSNRNRCSECGSSLVKVLEVKGKRYAIRVEYQDWDWKPTEVYEARIKPIIQNQDRSRFSLDKLIDTIWKDNKIPSVDRITIHKFIIFRNFNKYPVVQVWIRRGTHLFDYIESYAKEFGVYLHITGPPLPRELVSCWFDQKDTVSAGARQLSFKRLDRNEKRSSVKLIAAGGNQNSMLLHLGGLRILLDAGFYWPSDGTTECSVLLEEIKPDKLDLVVISHAHSDHIQGLVDLYEKHDCMAPLLATRATMELGLTRDRDYQNIVKSVETELEKDTNFHVLTREEQEVRLLENASKLLDDKFSRLLEKLMIVSYDEELRCSDNFSIRIMQAGHLPGGIMALFTLNGYSVLYTGDFNLMEFEPIASARSALKTLKVRPDAVICDGSAADLEFPKESLTQSRLYSDIFGTYSNGGTTLLLSDHNVGAIVTYFALRQRLVARAGGRIPFYFDEATWEQMCILRDRADDLAQSIQDQIQDHNDPFHSVMIRRLESDYPHLGGIGLKKAAASQCVISMDAHLHGHLSEEKFGALREVLAGEKNLIVIIGAPKSSGTQDLIAGRKWIEVGLETDKEYHRLQVKCKVLNSDLESHQLFNYHPDKDQLLEFFDTLMPKKVVFFHNPPNAFIDIRREISKRPYMEDHEVLHRYNRVAILR